MTLQYGPTCHDYGIRGYGDPEHGVIVVGIAPGYDEMRRSKRPFTGESGKLLDACLAGGGWSREKVYATNVLCWLNNKPNEQELEGCRERFQRELRLLRPRLIITCGQIANEQITGFKRRKGSRGSVEWSSRWNSWVLDTHHPSYALQSQSMSNVQDIIRDMSKIQRILDWDPALHPAHVIYCRVNTLQEAQEALDGLPKDRIVTLDIETSNPDPENIDAYSDALLTFSVSWKDDLGHKRTVVFPTSIFTECVRNATHARSWRAKGECPTCSQIGPSVLLWPRDVHWGFQFGQYDIQGIWMYFGIRLPLCEDTGLLSHCADERPGYHGLKPNAREWLAAGFYEADVKKYYKGKMHLLKPEDVELYNACDSAYTLDLEPIHRARAVEDETYDSVYKNLLLPAMDTFIDMQIRGINIDQHKLQDIAYGSWFPKYVEMYAAMQARAQAEGWPTGDFNFNSNKQMRGLFFDILKLEPKKFSRKTGNPSLDKEVLDQMDHPMAAEIRAYRALDGMIDCVFSIMSNTKYDALIHPSAFVTTTRTGRTSYHDPPMHNAFPKEYTVGADYARLREIIIPHNPSTHEIMEADYEQIEVWLAWAWSKDELLHQHLLSGDVHSATAELAFKTKRDLWPPDQWQVKRQNAKKIRFGIQYGEGPEKLASPPPVGIGGSVADARLFIANYKSAYPVYAKWMDDIQRQALTDGYLRTPSGRVMRFPVVMDHKQLRQAMNFPIQSTGTDYTLISMIELHQRLREYNSWLLLNNHDALVIESDRRYRPQVMTLVREVMERVKFPGFPSIKVEIKVGDNLGVAKKVQTAYAAVN